MEKSEPQIFTNRESNLKAKEEARLDLNIDFEKFIRSLGQAAQQELDFEQTNTLVKLNKKDYLPFTCLADYFRQIFSRKTNSAKRLKWHSKDKFVLLWVLSKYCDLFNIRKFRLNLAHWEDIASILKLDREFLMRKWICMLHHTTCIFQWSKSQDIVLEKQMREGGNQSNWSELSIKIFQQTDVCFLRTCKDIRERWKNYLDPTLKKIAWSEEEDNILVDLIKLHGKKWSLIAKTIQGRTQNQVKNRFITLFKKRKMSLGPSATKSQADAPKNILKEETSKPHFSAFYNDQQNPPELTAEKVEEFSEFDGHMFVQQVLQKDTDQQQIFPELTLF